jgi:hypothetical protein
MIFLYYMSALVIVTDIGAYSMKTGELFRYRRYPLKGKGKQSYAKTNMLGAGNKEFVLIGG